MLRQIARYRVGLQNGPQSQDWTKAGRGRVEYLAAIMTVGGSLFAMQMMWHMMHTDEGPWDDAMTLLYVVLAFGGTLGGTALFLSLV